MFNSKADSDLLLLKVLKLIFPTTTHFDLFVVQSTPLCPASRASFFYQDKKARDYNYSLLFKQYPENKKIYLYEVKRIILISLVDKHIQEQNK